MNELRYYAHNNDIQPSIVIKRYKNRKLYYKGKYVTVNDIIERLKNDIDVTIISHDDNKDVTNSVLRECIKKIDLTTEDLISIIRCS